MSTEDTQYKIMSKLEELDTPLPVFVVVEPEETFKQITDAIQICQRKGLLKDAPGGWLVLPAQVFAMKVTP